MRYIILKVICNIRKNRSVRLFLAVVGTAVILTGCGQDEAVSADVVSTDVVVPEEEKNADTTDSDNPAEETTGVGSVTADDVDTQSGTESQPEEAGARPIEMDDETRQQLTKELLEENELDTSVTESTRSTSGCTFDIPEGFEESQDVANLYVTARYPLDASMIYYEVMDGDISLQLMTEELFREDAEDNLRQAYGDDISLNIDSFESVKVSGHPAFRILCNYETGDIKITQLQYLVNADKTYTVTYSQTSDYDWMEAFEASAATIRVK